MDYQHLLNDTITVATHAGQDAHGTDTYNVQQKIPARVETAYALKMALRNSDFMFSHAICVTIPLNPKDRVWLGADNPNNIADARLVKRSESAYVPDMTTSLYMAYL